MPDDGLASQVRVGEGRMTVQRVVPRAIVPVPVMVVDRPHLQRLEFELGHDPAYVSDLQAKALADCLQRVMAAFSTDVQQAVGALQPVSAEERAQLLAFNPAPSAFPLDATLHALVRRQARATPEAVAVIDGPRQLSYAELDGQSDLLARQLGWALASQSGAQARSRTGRRRGLAALGRHRHRAAGDPQGRRGLSAAGHQLPHGPPAIPARRRPGGPDDRRAGRHPGAGRAGRTARHPLQRAAAAACRQPAARARRRRVGCLQRPALQRSTGVRDLHLGLDRRAQAGGGEPSRRGQPLVTHVRLSTTPSARATASWPPSRWASTCPSASCCCPCCKGRRS